MSSKNKIAILLFILVASLSLWLYLHNSTGTIRKELYDFAVADTASITKIYMISTAGQQVTLTKEKPGQWQVNGKYKARTDAVRSLLVCMKDLQVRNPVAKSAIANVSKQMASNSTKVEVYQNDKLVKVYYVGSDTQDGLGTFMLLSDPETGENSSAPFIMFISGFNGFLSVRYFLEEELWRDKSVFAFYPDQIASIGVEYTHMKDSSFSITLINGNTLALSDNKGKNIPNFDTLKAKQYVTYYSNMPYEKLVNDLPPKLKDSVLNNAPVHVVTLIDRVGKSHILKTFAKPNPLSDKTDPVTGRHITEDLEHMYALINDGKDMAMLQYYVFGKLFPLPSHFKKGGTTNINPPSKK